MSKTLKLDVVDAEPADGDWRAPFLPSLNLPDCPEVVKHVAEYPNYKHTGRTSCRDAKKCCRVIELRLMDWGWKRIALELKMSKWTVQAIWERAEEEKILAPFKEQFEQKGRRIAITGLDAIAEGIDDPRVPLHHKSIALGVVMTKMGELAGAGVDLAPVAGPAPSVEGLNKFLAGAPDVSSSGELANHARNEAGPSAGASAGASSMPIPASTSRSEEGGGGDQVSGPGAREDEVSASGEPCAKGPSEESPTI